MPELVFNTGPVIALTAALGSLVCLKDLYDRVLLPFEVFEEVKAGGKDCPELAALLSCPTIEVMDKALDIPVLLSTQLDIGEASVIQTALLHSISTVAIDEKMGRRMARLHGLKVTGTLGILIRANQLKLIPDIEICLDRMKEKGVWISDPLRQKTIHAAMRK